MVGRLDDVEVMFDDDHTVPIFDQAIEAFQQPVDVGKMQSCRRQARDCREAGCRVVSAGPRESMSFFLIFDRHGIGLIEPVVDRGIDRVDQSTVCKKVARKSRSRRAFDHLLEP